MAAIVGDALVMWPTGGHGMSYVARDAGLKAARDVCLVGPNRLVVALSNALVMISDKGRLILGAVSGRVRYDEGTLYVLDERTGLIWTLNGLDAVGIPEKDAAHAANLLRIGGDASQRRAAFEEAVRIMGCKAATGRRQSGWK